jgi:tetratricopeptide (TPR) repeat protein
VGSTTTGTANNGSTGTFGSTNANSSRAATPDFSRPLFLMGNVLFDDGTSPNNQIRIERVCSGGGVRVESHTDSQGHFSFQVGSEQGSNISEAQYANTGFGDKTNDLPPGLGSGRDQSLLGCELRAAYPGYLSERVDLSEHSTISDAQVGTIILHRVNGVTGTTVSITSTEAPKSARKNFEKGVQLAHVGKFAEAESRLASATSEYPKYAEAWVALGDVQVQLNKPEVSRKSFLAAIAADPRFVNTYDHLARISASRQNWQEAADYSRQATDLNPFEFPSSFWYNALANYNLQRNADAEKSALALARLDSRHHYPDVETMLAEFAASRGDLASAASHLKAFLAEAPNAKNADLVKSQLARVETVLSERASAAH